MHLRNYKDYQIKKKVLDHILFNQEAITNLVPKLPFNPNIHNNNTYFMWISHSIFI